MPIDQDVLNAMRVTDTYIWPAGMRHVGFQLATGTLNSAALTYAGDIEADGKALYGAFADGQKGVIPTVQFVYQSAAFVLQNSTSAQNMFAAANDALTVAAATTYFFESDFCLTTGATSASVGFLLAGTATLTSINYVAFGIHAASGTAGTPVMQNSVVATEVTVIAAGTGVNKRATLRGSIQINAAGTIIPQIKFSADPTGTCQTDIGSKFVLYPVGSNTVAAVGPWA